MIAPITRRKALSLLAITVGGAVVLPRSAFAQNATLITGADVCLLAPETTEGPFYFDPALVRRDITEGRPGLPTLVRLQVVDATCTPIAGARVDIWHCDAEGVYSGYAGQPGGDARGETFMRGTQVAGADGVVEFETIYPGWYGGRTPHIHFKILLDERSALTGQLFFPDEVSERVYATPPYAGRGQADTTNATDGIARRAGAAAMALVEELPERYEAAMIIGVDPARA